MDLICPHCNKKIELTDAIKTQIEKDIAQRYQSDLQKVKAEALEKAKKEMADALTEKEQTIVQYQTKLKTAQQKELSILEKERKLEDEKHALIVAYNEKLNAEVKKAYTAAQEKVDLEYQLKLREKEKVIDDLSKQMKEGQRKAEQGSMQLQGEVLEREIEKDLAKYFPEDVIEPVGVGKKGGDIVQIVKTSNGRTAGKILWELKRTKNWSGTWISKLKEDQRNCRAEIGVIASEVLPADIECFGCQDGIWITDIRFAIGLAAALRENLKAVAVIKAMNEGKAEKAELVYEYLTGTHFKQRVETILETYTEMQTDLDTEKRILEKSWAKREKQIERFIKNVAGMVGDLEGVGASLAEIKHLQLPWE